MKHPDVKLSSHIHVKDQKSLFDPFARLISAKDGKTGRPYAAPISGK